MRLEWRIDNILTDESSELVRRKINEDISPLKVAKNNPISELVKRSAIRNHIRFLTVLTIIRRICIMRIIDYCIN